MVSFGFCIHMILRWYICGKIYLCNNKINANYGNKIILMNICAHTVIMYVHTVGTQLLENINKYNAYIHNKIFSININFPKHITGI